MSNPPDKRTIKINPDLFKFSTTNTTRKKRDANTPRIKVKSENKEQNTKTLKRKLLKHIRSFQEETTRESTKKNKVSESLSKKDNIIDTPMSDNSHQFKDSMDYLLKLTKELDKKQQSAPRNYTLKHRDNVHIQDVLNTPNSFFVPTNEVVSLEMPSDLVMPISVPTQSCEPMYGCLKNGRKPTYRTWKNHTQRSYSTPVPRSLPSPGTILDPTQQRIQQIQQRAKITRVNQIASSPEPMKLQKQESQKLSDIIKREQMKQMKQLKIPKKLKRPKQCQKTMRRTYRVGRSKVAPRISVLVSNRTIRKNVTTQAQLLKQAPIKDVKQYLIRHGFIRVGSIAPNEVLRRMYETAQMMCGEIHNHNPENLLYNFLNGEGEP